MQFKSFDIIPHGTKFDFDNPTYRRIFGLYKQMIDENLVPTATRTEDGSTWQAQFIAGKIGILPLGSPIVGDLLTQTAVQWGVAALPAPDGGRTSTFIGGDVGGILVGEHGQVPGQHNL